ncbi:MAG: flagellar basal body rod protein FlgC [Candidatus Dadabacteria bacterium]|nr:MAG: flagellar basal body rod protein FlgC [Candidatus Dadabacteria bacterium]
MADISDILSAGLSAMRLRVNTIASNIANAQTTRTPEGGPYKRRDVVIVAKPEKSFQDALDNMTMIKPVVKAVVEDNSPPKMVYQPGHPDADENGYVAYPNINVVQSMTDLMTASRLYQANIAAMRTTSDMTRRARRIATVY